MGSYLAIIYVLISLKIIYILLGTIASFHKNSIDIDTRIVNLGKLKRYIKIFNEIAAYSFIIYFFNPFNKNNVTVDKTEKISLFLFALIGISNVKWNMILNLFGVNIKFFD